jgi:hypothetical protein
LTEGVSVLLSAASGLHDASNITADTRSVRITLKLFTELSFFMFLNDLVIGQVVNQGYNKVCAGPVTHYIGNTGSIVIIIFAGYHISSADINSF